MFLIVGLGNPGVRYLRTRHNVGFMLADRLAERGGGNFKKRTARSAVCELKRGEERLILAKPLTYMNLSGKAIRDLLGAYPVDQKRMLIAYDEAALPLGRIRLRRKGSAGGQKGMDSVISCLDTLEIPRLRIGVGGKRPAEDLVDYVLSEFEEEEFDLLEKVLDRALLACDVWMDEGIERAMSEFNVSVPL